jgi:hypothetical protein
MDTSHLDLPFRVKPARPMTQDDLPEWEPALAMLAKISREMSIKVKAVRLHNHKNSPKHDHSLAWADLDSREISLCDNSVETAIHEIAHLWSQEDHNKKWARCMLVLYRKYVPDQMVEYTKTLIKDYPDSARVVRNMKRSEQRRIARGSRTD